MTERRWWIVRSRLAWYGQIFAAVCTTLQGLHGRAEPVSMATRWELDLFAQARHDRQVQVSTAPLCGFE
jgi:hypothetical protein